MSAPQQWACPVCETVNESKSGRRMNLKCSACGKDFPTMPAYQEPKHAKNHYIIGTGFKRPNGQIIDRRDVVMKLDEVMNSEESPEALAARILSPLVEYIAQEIYKIREVA
jgi:hypothetical protein